MSKVIAAPAWPWDPTARWYRQSLMSRECLDPDTPHRVPGCSCYLCMSKLTDPALSKGVITDPNLAPNSMAHPGVGRVKW